MKTEQRHYENGAWVMTKDSNLGQDSNLVMVYGCRDLIGNHVLFEEVKGMYPNAHIISGTTAGEILDDMVHDDTLVVTAVQFEKTEIKVANMNINDAEDSFQAGVKLARQLDGDDLCHIFLLSDGLHVNGSEIVKGVNSELDNEIACTGGLAGDSANFETTLVGVDSLAAEYQIVALGFYGKELSVGYGSVGGWDTFGTERLVTKSEGNVLYELDGQSALDLYKMYLGEKAKELPGSALLFPLGMKFTEDSDTVVRTVLGVDDEANSMTFAGDIPEGCYVRLMKANFDKLIEGAKLAAEHSKDTTGDDNSLAVLISCVGRKLILGQRSDEEVEAVKDILGESTTIAGFYSYGEISPLLETAKCQLHNQTMTITTFAEK
jgi:hypothetical protein